MSRWVGWVVALQLVLTLLQAPLAASPLTCGQVEKLLKSKVSSQRIAELVSQRKAACQLTRTTARKLRGLGAEENLLAAIRENALTPVLVESEPAGAEVFLDGRYRGRTPVLLEKAEPGRHELQVGRVEGYQEHAEEILLQAGEPWKKRIVLKRGEPPPVAPDPQPEPGPPGRQQPGPKPPGGQGEAAGEQELPAPTATDEAATGSAGVPSGTVPPPALEAQRQLVPVRVRTEPVSAEIYLDDKHIAASPADFLVSVGQHHLRLVPTLSAQYETVEKEISVSADQLNVFFLRLNSK